MSFGSRPSLSHMDVLVVVGSITPADIPGLCARAGAIFRRTNDDLLCDLEAVAEPDAAVVDALARLQLLAKRQGRQILLLNADPSLRELLELAGLDEVVPCGDELGVEASGQPEEREHPSRIEEEADPGDLPV